MSATEAAAVTREICVNLREALRRLADAGQAIRPVVVSRSDSTLRGHYPVETDVIAEELGPFDAHFLVPAFFEGGRITRDGVHYLLVDGQPVPVNETEFASDSVFGYRHAFLPDYVEEKTAGRIAADQVERFGLTDIRADIGGRLRALHGNVCCVVDAECQADLDGFARQVLAAAGGGQAVSLPQCGQSADRLCRTAAAAGGAGRHVPVRAQWTRGGGAGRLACGEIDPAVAERSSRPRTCFRSKSIWSACWTTRRRCVGICWSGSPPRRPTIGAWCSIPVGANASFRPRPSGWPSASGCPRCWSISCATCRATIGFLISKGGITSNDTLSKGLALRTARVLGQIHPGCSVVRCPDDHPRFAGLPVVIFPGNVGGDEALADVYRILAGRADRSGESSGLRSLCTIPSLPLYCRGIRINGEATRQPPSGP